MVTAVPDEKRGYFLLPYHPLNLPGSLQALQLFAQKALLSHCW